MPLDVPWFAVWFLNLLLASVVFSLVLPIDARVVGTPFTILGWMIGPFWLLIHAKFMRKLTGNRAPLILGRLASGALFLACITLTVSSHLGEYGGYYYSQRGSIEVIGDIMLLASVPLYLAACLYLQWAMEEYYNVGIFSLGLDSRRTIAFGVLYLQYHFSLIRQNKITNQSGLM